uniref:Putative atp-dependent dna ligase iii n=1 Tax=Ixodes ricinus TaxID=34613 RepID=A0A0K8RMA1_IXORI
MADTRFCIEYAKRGTAGCKKCKAKIDKEVLRIAKIVPNPFSDSGGDMKQWFHVDCIFEQLSRARATTKRSKKPKTWKAGQTFGPTTARWSSNTSMNLPAKPALQARRPTNENWHPRKDPRPRSRSSNLHPRKRRLDRPLRHRATST